jgi:hypothetical protein
MSNNDLQYWASASVEDVVAACDDKKTAYYKFCQQNGWLWIWGLCFDFYFSGTNRQALAFAVGDANQLLVTKINDFRNLIQHSVGIIINQRPTWEILAANSDYESLAQTSIAKSILNYYQDAKGLDARLYDVVVSTKKFGEGFIVTTWDQSIGKIVAALPNGKNEDGTDKVVKIHEGDLDVRAFEPIDVIRDPSIVNQEQNHWYIVRERKNKYDLAMKFPDQYSDIIGHNLETQPTEHYVVFDRNLECRDLVYVYTLYHKKTAALPEGRIVSYLTPGIILSDNPMSYDDFPVLRMVDTPIPNTNFSYTDAFDMLQIQDELDGLYSSVLSNQRAFAVQNIIMPIGSNIPIQSLAGNLNVITYDPSNGGKPEALQLCATPPEVFKSIEMLTAKLGTISGVNGAAQGNPPPGVTSGVALSFLQSMNVQYAQGAQQSYVTTLSHLGTSVINILKQNARTERVIEIAGSSKGTMAKAFTGDHLQGISRVIARPGNPMMQTIQGRYALATEIVGKGLTNEASTQMLTVLETGSLESLTEGRFNIDIQIKSENEELRNGKTIAVVAFDDHLAHITEHQSITADINLRSAKANTQEAKIFKNVTEHILQHLSFLTDPANMPLLTALGQHSIQGAPNSQPQASPQGNTSVNVNGGQQQATAAGLPGNAGLQGAQPTKAVPAQGTPTGQFPQQLINQASKQK